MISSLLYYFHSISIPSNFSFIFFHCVQLLYHLIHSTIILNSFVCIFLVCLFEYLFVCIFIYLLFFFLLVFFFVVGFLFCLFLLACLFVVVFFCWLVRF